MFIHYEQIGVDSMIHIRDHKARTMVDPWEYLGLKRRKLLEESWAGLLRGHILPELPVDQIACYTAVCGRPSKELYASLGVLILQQMHDLTDQETVLQFAFNEQWHYALDIVEESDAQSISVRRRFGPYSHPSAYSGSQRPFSVLLAQGQQLSPFRYWQCLLPRQKHRLTFYESIKHSLGEIGIFLSPPTVV